MRSEMVIFNMNRDASDQNFSIFMDVVRWVEFIAEFWEQWADADWIPSFDMLMTDTQNGKAPARKFGGTVTVYSGEERAD